LIFLLLDVTHYLIHWLEHRFRVFWLFHSIHHSSEYYNFSTAIRGPLATAIYRFLYVGPFCLLGFDPTTVFIVDQMIILYAFFLHTERIGKLGLLEYFMNTPSHHRVHHSSNEEYLDKNFGACLIVWDRLFGTFAEEKTKPVYGLTTPLKSHNPLKIISHECLLLWSDLRAADGICNAMNTLLNYPGWKRHVEPLVTGDVKKIKYAFITISLLMTIVQVNF
jgi:sterol desaturase/sphingolipid hydroxylase (fatty acid hydroxylase superfamily)